MKIDSKIKSARAWFGGLDQKLIDGPGSIILHWMSSNFTVYTVYHQFPGQCFRENRISREMRTVKRMRMMHKLCARLDRCASFYVQANGPTTKRATEYMVQHDRRYEGHYGALTYGLIALRLNHHFVVWFSWSCRARGKRVHEKKKNRRIYSLVTSPGKEEIFE